MNNMNKWIKIKNKPLTSPLQGAMDKDKDKDKDKDMDNIYMAKHAWKLFVMGTNIQAKIQ